MTNVQIKVKGQGNVFRVTIYSFLKIFGGV